MATTIGWAQSHLYNDKFKLIRHRYNTIRQVLSIGVITIDYIKSKNNLTDPLTKGINKELVEMRLMPMEQVSVKETRPMLIEDPKN